MVNLQVEPEAGLGGEAPLAGPTGQLALLQVDLAVGLELGGDAEGLAAVRATVTPRLRVDAPVVLEGQEVGVGLEAHGTVVDADGVGVFVVEEGAGMTVSAAALITSVKRQKEEGGGKGTLATAHGAFFTNLAD